MEYTSRGHYSVTIFAILNHIHLCLHAVSFLAEGKLSTLFNVVLFNTNNMEVSQGSLNIYWNGDFDRG